MTHGIFFTDVDPVEDVAYGQLTAQSSDSNVQLGATANRAVDGLSYTFATTGQEAWNWWRVQLAKMSYINKLIINVDSTMELGEVIQFFIDKA